MQVLQEQKPAHAAHGLELQIPDNLTIFINLLLLLLLNWNILSKTFGGMDAGKELQGCTRACLG